MPSWEGEKLGTTVGGDGLLRSSGRRGGPSGRRGAILRVLGLGSLSGSLPRRRRASRAGLTPDFAGEVGASATWVDGEELRVASAGGERLVASPEVERSNAEFCKGWSELVGSGGLGETTDPARSEEFGEVDSGSARSLELVEVMYDSARSVEPGEVIALVVASAGDMWLIESSGVGRASAELDPARSEGFGEVNSGSARSLELVEVVYGSARSVEPGEVVAITVADGGVVGQARGEEGWLRRVRGVAPRWLCNGRTIARLLRHFLW